MVLWRALALLIVFMVLGRAPLSAQQVLVKPYVQPGRSGSLDSSDDKYLCWLTDQVAGEFTVEFVVADQSRIAIPQRIALDFAKAPSKMPVEPEDPDHPPEKTGPLPPEREQHFYKYSAHLEKLPLDADVRYSVKLGGKVVRDASFRTRSSATKPIRFAMVGDLANGKSGQNTIAHRIAQEKPELLVALGDIVYPNGRVNQYMHYFWKTYNDVEVASPQSGAPLMASVPFHVLLGNHDVAAKYPTIPDALAAYYFFHAPTNGPGVGPWCTPLGSDKPAAAKFREINKESYPSLDVYSFDNGPAHFLILNSNRSGNVDEPKLRTWVENDLRSSKAKWKFVCYHVPAFQSSTQHYTEQSLRLWQPLFEECGVDVVWAGHVHNYQRSVPLRFAPSSPKRDKRGRVDGAFTFDRTFNGETATTPRGVIHIVAGGGGATLYGPGLEKTALTLRKDHGDNYADYTAKMVADRHSFVMVELTPQRFTLRALDPNGAEIDRCIITKP